MPRYKMVATASAKAGADEAFNRWYDERHLPDVLAIPGFLSAERYMNAGPDGPRYLAIYEIETDDIASVMAEFASRPGTDAMPISDTLDFSAGQLGFWRPYMVAAQS